MAPPPRPLLVERTHHGHRLMYIALLATAAHEQGGRATVLLHPDAPASTEYRIHLAPIEDTIDVVTDPAITVAGILGAAREHRCDRIVVPDADTLLPGFLRHGWRRLPVPATLLVMRPGSQGGARSTVASVVKRTIMAVLRKRPGTAIYTLASALRPAGAHEVSDPAIIDASDTAIADLRALAGLDNDRFWFGVIGAITGRKNVDLVLDALAHLDHRRTGLLIAGRISSDIADSLARAITTARESGARVAVVDDFLENEQVDAAVAAVDCVVLAHSNEGSSGILSKATRAGTRVLAAGARSLRDDVAIIGTGARWCPLDVESLRATMAAMLDEPAPPILDSDGARDFRDKLLG
ncbi:glycosyltransferase [Lolliginicoccus suaedae]|uniref:glycosyltransferase n=1 Tax=Lolliginicoccus suaedae TaxID=2605429 RepID=UPI0011ED33FB|nr:glycosyltransferase [Lolliginicoccus suaedae]